MIDLSAQGKVLVIVDNESDPGSWERELKARGTWGPRILQQKVHCCKVCLWTGEHPSITDASSVVMRDGKLEMERTHLLVCPRCLHLIHRAESRERVPANADA